MRAVDLVTLNLRALVVWGAMPTREDVAASVPVDQVWDAGLRARIERMVQVYSLPSHVAAYIAGRALAGDGEGLRCWNAEALQVIGLRIAERRLPDQVDRTLYAKWYAEDLKEDLSALAEYAVRFRKEDSQGGGATMKRVGEVCITSPLTAAERRRLSKWVEQTDPDTWPTGHHLARRLMVVVGRPFEYVLETGR